MDAFTRPRTSEEARNMIEEAIEAMEFEKVELLQRELESIENYEEVVDLGGNVTDYFHVKEDFMDECGKTMKISEHQLEIAKKNVKKYFIQRFLEIKARQKSEIQYLFNEWNEARENAQDDFQEEYEKCLETSKVMARSGHIKEAIEIRDSANAKFHQDNDSLIEEVDKVYEKKCATLQRNHRVELENLLLEKEEEENSIEIIKTTSDGEALKRFIMGHSDAVVSTSAKLSNKGKAPIALKMQTINVNTSNDDTFPTFVERN